MMKWIIRYGFFRLTQVPLGMLIIVSAFLNGIWGMGFIGAVVLVFGIFNKCLLLGRCDIEDAHSENKRKR